MERGIFSRFVDIWRCLLLVVLTLIFSVPAARADNWPQWRGPQGNGICDETNIPIRWSRTQNVHWRLELPGPAGATPIVWNEQIFLTSVDANDLLLICVSTDGKRQWRRNIGVGNKDVRRDEGNSASPSPVTDGEFVWATMANGAMACYDFDGNEQWRTNLQERYGPFQIQFGMTSTPVLYGDRLFLQFIHGDYQGRTKEASVIALDKRTGEEIWRQERITEASGENEHSYASPMLYDDGKLRFLITHGGDYVMGHRLSDGEEIWRCGGLNPHDVPGKRYHPTMRFVASPAAAPGIIVVPSAKNGPVLAIRPNFAGDITDNPEARLWTLSRGTPDVPSPLIHDGIVYLCREQGNLMCHDAWKGTDLYIERTRRNRHRASPVYADGHVYLSSRDGIVSVVKTGREFELVTQNDIGESLTASPAISNGTLYLRSYEALWAIRNQ
jgi:outer membrane protein assembly factor BamB